jgi:hypothetical protein
MSERTDERREHVRVEVEFEAALAWGDQSTPSAVQDMSAGGAYFRVNHPPGPGTELLAHIVYEENASPVTIRARVMWSMEGKSARIAGGCGVLWLEASCPDLKPMRGLLHDTMKVAGGELKPDHDEEGNPVYRYTFGHTDEASVPEAPAPASGVGVTEQTGASNASRRANVNIPVKFIAKNNRGSGVICVLGERRAVIETSGEELPGHSDRVEVRASIDSSGGVLPIVLHGQVTRTLPETDVHPASFWLMLSRVDEKGRTGLFRQFLDFLSEDEEE